MDLASTIRSIPDFPQKGIIFRDITTLLKNPEAMVESIDRIAETLEGIDFDYVIGPESRGFIFGMPVAYKLKKGFIPVRKPGKLPAKTVSKEYSLEYGTATIEMHEDALKKGDKVVIIDDLIATTSAPISSASSSKAIVELAEEMGAEVVALRFAIELDALKGRDVLRGYDIKSIINY